MTVKELIEKLSKLPMDAPIITWDMYRDCDSSSVIVSKTNDGRVFILNIALGEEV